MRDEQLGAEGPAGARARSAWRRDLLLPWAPRESDQGAVARRSRNVAVFETARGGEVHLADEPERGGCFGLGSAARLSSGRDRLAQSALDPKACFGRITLQ